MNTWLVAHAHAAQLDCLVMHRVMQRAGVQMSCLTMHPTSMQLYMQTSCRRSGTRPHSVHCNRWPDRPWCFCHALAAQLACLTVHVPATALQRFVLCLMVCPCSHTCGPAVGAPEPGPPQSKAGVLCRVSRSCTHGPPIHGPQYKCTAQVTN